MSSSVSRDDSLYATLVELTGRRLSMSDIYKAFGLSKSQYHRLVSGKGVTADQLITAARNLGINPFELQTRVLPDVTEQDAVEFVTRKRSEAVVFVEPRLSTTERRPDAPMP